MSISKKGFMRYILLLPLLSAWKTRKTAG